MTNFKTLENYDRGQDFGGAFHEVALALPVFFLMILGVIEFSLMAYSRINIEHALSEAGRAMITGQGIDLTNSDPNARLTFIENKFCQNLVASGISCSNLNSHFTVTCINPAVCTSPGPVSCTDGCTQVAGGPGQTVTIKVAFTKSWASGLFKKIFPVSANLNSSMTWKNEPFL